MINLRDLDLSNNDIERIEGLNNLKKLRVLNLQCNKISKIEGISTLKALEVLNISRNLIDEIPQTILHLSNLQELYIANNNIERRQSLYNLKNAPKLTTLDLTGNPICQMFDYFAVVSTTLKRLEYLDGKVITRHSRRASLDPSTNL